jgi:PTH1 family peptidyl-tRNA hydrolase
VRLIVGLRNPGRRYHGTRHNVGAEVIEIVADRHRARLRKARLGIRADVGEIGHGDARCALALPRTFMNESGQAVAPLLRYFRVPPEDLLVVHDDIDLPFGRMRVQHDRSSGGNRGIRSIVGSLDTGAFWRLKIGVGRPPGRLDPADFVLQRFSKDERTEMDFVVADAADVVDQFAAGGGDSARRLAGELNGRRGGGPA